MTDSRDLNNLEDIIDGLNEAPRIGAEKDEPEGSRYIQLSETLVNKITTILKSKIYD